MTFQTERWDDYADQYRTDWERMNPNRRWDDVEHGYRYGWEAAMTERYHGRSYADVESDLRRGWSAYDRGAHTSSAATQLEHAWEDVKDTVRDGWEKAKAQFR
jgi:hypothetical protein